MKSYFKRNLKGLWKTIPLTEEEIKQLQAKLEDAEHKAMLNQVDHNYLEQLTNDYEQLQANLEATED